ncbi:MAG: periplasmic heavy metal sensor [Caulobacter sp.]|nr:periplasmic heavy metal sensor [Caulobacter sp.]
MKPRTLIIALVASVALNLFLAGLIVGGVAVARRAHELRPPASAQIRTPLWRAGDALPQPKRRAFRQLVRQAGSEMRDDVRQSRAIRREAIAALEAEPFDAGAAAAEMSRARQMDTAARGRVEARIMTFAATLTPSERGVLAAGLRQAMAGQLKEPPPRGERARTAPKDR